MGTGKFDAGGQGEHCDGLASHAGGMVASCYRNWDTLRPYIPPGVNANSLPALKSEKVSPAGTRTWLLQVCRQACWTGQFVLPVHRHFRHLPNLKNILMRKWHLIQKGEALERRTR